MAVSKSKAKSVPVIEVLHAEHVDTDSMQFSLKDFLALAGVQLPGWKRVLVSAVASLAAGYLIGNVASVVCNIMFSGAVAVTGSIFVAWMLYTIGFIIAVYLAIKAGAAIGRYIVGKHIDRDYETVKAKTSGWFSFGKKKELTAA